MGRMENGLVGFVMTDFCENDTSGPSRFQNINFWPKIYQNMLLPPTIDRIALRTVSLDSPYLKYAELIFRPPFYSQFQYSEFLPNNVKRLAFKPK